MNCQMQIQNNECLRIKIELASISTELGFASFKYASFWNHTFCRLIYRTIGVFVTFRVDFIIIDFLILKLCVHYLDSYGFALKPTYLFRFRILNPPSGEA